MTLTTSDTDAQTVAIMLCHSPFTHTVNETALRYVESLLQQGHSIYRIFLYHEATHLATNMSITAQDETSQARSWQALIQKHKIDCVACISSSLKRGIIDTSEAQRYDLPQHNLALGITLGGLGDWIDAVNCADTHISFN